MRKLLLAGMIAASATTALTYPESRSQPLCDRVFRALDELESAALGLNNFEGRWIFTRWANYIKNSFTNSEAVGRFETAKLIFKLVNGYDVEPAETISDTPSMTRFFIENDRRWFKINLENGAPCNLKEW